MFLNYYTAFSHLSGERATFFVMFCDMRTHDSHNVHPNGFTDES